MLAGPCAIASAILILRHVVADLRPQPQVPSDELSNMVVVDGSNVMHWNGGEPRLETVLEVLAYLRWQGRTPGIVFDANAGYKIAGKYLHDGSFAKRLGLPQDRVMVVPKGTPADPYILTAARDLGACIVSNDRFRDWADSYPEIASPSNVIKGGYRQGRLWLDLQELSPKP